MVCAFKGWNDAGESATSALTFIAGSLGAEAFARIDPEDFVDFQATRPMVRLEDGVSRTIDWPEFEVHAVRIPRAPRDLVLLSGPEPAFRWRTFTKIVIDLAEALNVQMAVLLGALLADVPHSRPVSVSAHATDPGLIQRLALQPPSYEGPTGIVGVLLDACVTVDVPAVSFWAAVPHYLPQPPCPKATLALLGHVEDLLEISIPMGDLPEDARAWERGVAELAEEDEDIAEYVRMLEENQDTAELPEASGEAIAKEFERYLKRRDRDDG
jgi:proteasome assembly chaperone (PAC2) family protein